MKDVKIGMFVNLINSGESIIRAAKRSDIMNLPIITVLEELSKEDYYLDWDILAIRIASGE